jgi:predicted nucleic acid-binding protein
MPLVVDASVAFVSVLPDENGTAAAMRYGLTAYDAAYVDLASRERLTLATLDGPMRKAAEQSGVTIFRQ